MLMLMRGGPALAPPQMNRRVLAAFLQNDGHVVSLAVDGADAVAQFEVQMPRLDGHGATRAIRGVERGLGLASPTPIVACTAFSSSHDRAGVMSSGMSDYLSKPVARSLLLSVISKWAPRRGSVGAPAEPGPAAAPPPPLAQAAQTDGEATAPSAPAPAP
eukprot:tig00000640_g2765.t1